MSPEQQSHRTDSVDEMATEAINRNKHIFLFLFVFRHLFQLTQFVLCLINKRKSPAILNLILKGRLTILINDANDEHTIQNEPNDPIELVRCAFVH